MLGIGRPFTWKSEGCDFGAYHPANISFGKLHIDLIYRLYNIVFQYVKWREANLFCWKAWVSQKRMLPTHWEHWEFPTPIFQYTYVTYVLNAVVTFSCPNSNRSESFRLDITSPSSPYFGGPNMFALNMSHVTCQAEPKKCRCWASSGSSGMPWEPGQRHVVATSEVFKMVISHRCWNRGSQSHGGTPNHPRKMDDHFSIQTYGWLGIPRF